MVGIPSMNQSEDIEDLEEYVIDIKSSPIQKYFP